jgi:arsenate reductase
VIGCNEGVRWPSKLPEKLRRCLNPADTVCDNAKESCPIFPGGGKRLHQSFEDPAAASANQQLEVFRKVRDQIADRLQEFLRSES